MNWLNSEQILSVFPLDSWENKILARPVGSNFYKSWPFNVVQYFFIQQKMKELHHRQKKIVQTREFEN